MSPRCTLLFGAVIAIGAQVLFAQNDPAIDLNQILKEAAAIKLEQQQTRISAIRSAISEIQAVAHSPADAGRAYLEAIEITEFSGKKGGFSKFMDWKKAKQDVVTNRILQSAAQLHLRYLQMTLERALNPDAPPPYPALFEYARELVAVQKQIDDLGGLKLSPEQRKDLSQRIEDLLKTSVADGPFAKAYRLTPLIGDLGNWEMSPGNLGQILEKGVRAVLREQNDPRIADTWDLQIQFEQTLADRNTTDHAREAFANERIPRLLWAKASDLYAIGNVNQGLSAMLQVVKSHPAHPEAGKWVKEITERAEAQLNLAASAEGKPPEAESSAP